MSAIQRVLLGACLLMGAVLLWDAWPFYANADNVPVESSEATASLSEDAQVAVFAGGCFWCMEHPFDQLDGVIDTTSGYTGGDQENPTYYEVSAGDTGHVEAVRITYDPTRISYGQLLDVFWRNVDPLDDRGQFCDKGSQYRSAIFALDGQQRQQAIDSQQALEAAQDFGSPIATEVLPAKAFYPAEEYHQDYYLKHPVRYKFYRNGCGRDRRLRQLWGESAS